MAALHQAPGCAPPSSSLQGVRGGGRQGCKGRMGQTSMRRGLEENGHVSSTHLPPSSSICFCRLNPHASPSSSSDTAQPRGPWQPSHCHHDPANADGSPIRISRRPMADNDHLQPEHLLRMRFSYSIWVGSSSTKSKEELKSLPEMHFVPPPPPRAPKPSPAQVTAWDAFCTSIATSRTKTFSRDNTWYMDTPDSYQSCGFCRRRCRGQRLGRHPSGAPGTQ